MSTTLQCYHYQTNRTEGTQTRKNIENKEIEISFTKNGIYLTVTPKKISYPDISQSMISIFVFTELLIRIYYCLFNELIVLQELGRYTEQSQER